MTIKRKLNLLAGAILITSVSSTAILADDKIGVTQDVGVSITGYYKYSEPDFMHNKSEVQDHLLNNFGLLYNVKNNFLYEGYLNQIEFDADFKRFDINYWSNGTGTQKDIENDVYDLRALYGMQASDKLMLKTGYGYRHLLDKKKGGYTSTGAGPGYDRIQEYSYIPLIAEANLPMAGVNGKLKFEYDYFVYGKNKNEYPNSTSNNQHRNDDGSAWKISYKFPYSGINIEPYYEFLSVQRSTTDLGYLEPANTTKEVGVKFSKTFGEEELKSVPNGKRLFSNEKIYIGAEALSVNLDTGMSNGSSGVNIDEKSLGFSILGGFEINKNLDFEISYNDFGKANISFGNSGSTIKTDGRYNNHANASGTTLSTSQNNVAINYRTYSTGVALKPKFDLEQGFYVNGTLGYAEYLQSEVTSYPNSGNSTSMKEYQAHDWFYGVGVGKKIDNNFDISINYKKYQMYYDAEVLSASVRYIF
jgi:OmpA-like transmembrane domain